MGIGPGKTRVFRMEDGVISPVPIKKNDQVVATKSKPSIANNVATKTIIKKPQEVSLGVLVEPIRVQYRLRLSTRQKTKLENLFMAPKALAALIRDYPDPLLTSTDAAVFLLTNRKKLDGYINPNNRERSVNLLTDLLLRWAGNPPDSVGIDFDDVSLTPDNQVYLPLDGFGTAEVQSPTALMKLRKDRKFSIPFTVFEQGKNFYVAFTLEPKTKQYSRSNNSLQALTSAKPKEIKLLPGQPLPYISGRRDEPPEPRQRILFSKYSGVFRGGVRTMNWGGLSGWGVNGGLPSLGKRSR